jgi:hypothetical protein
MFERAIIKIVNNAKLLISFEENGRLEFPTDVSRLEPMFIPLPFGVFFLGEE